MSDLKDMPVVTVEQVLAFREAALQKIEWYEGCVHHADQEIAELKENAAIDREILAGRAKEIDWKTPVITKQREKIKELVRQVRELKEQTRIRTTADEPPTGHFLDKILAEYADSNGDTRWIELSIREAQKYPEAYPRWTTLPGGQEGE